MNLERKRHTPHAALSLGKKEIKLAVVAEWDHEPLVGRESARGRGRRRGGIVVDDERTFRRTRFGTGV